VSVCVDGGGLDVFERGVVSGEEVNGVPFGWRGVLHFAGASFRMTRLLWGCFACGGCGCCVVRRLRPCVLGCALAESRHAAAVPGDNFKQVRVGCACRELN